MPAYTQSLEKALQQALTLANEREHEYATLEHLLLALLDALNMEKSLLTTVGALRFPLFAGAVLWWVNTFSTTSDRPGLEEFAARTLRLLGAGVAVLRCLWCADAWLQFLTGENSLGYGRGEGYINGLFGEDDNIKLGLTTALLMPLGVVYLAREHSIAAAFLLLAFVASVVLLSGKRAAWNNVPTDTTAGSPR